MKRHISLLLLFICSLSSSTFASVEIASDHQLSNYDIEHEGEWEGSFFFVQMADCQIGMMDYNKSWLKEIELIEKAVEIINKIKPRYVILCGDLTNAFPFEPSYKDQVADYKRTIQKIDQNIPLLCLCGNHDVGNSPSRTTIQAYEDHFGSHYYSFWVSGTQNFVLNTSLYNDSSKAPELLQEQNTWIHKELADETSTNKAIHRFIFGHHPWFLHEPDERENYYNIKRSLRYPFLEAAQRGSITACFAGHFHQNAHGVYKGMEMITTSALGLPLGVDSSGLRIIKVYKDRIEHEFYELDNIPQAIVMD
ncbi:Serine/threonine-protein phosphatase CPPED1 [Chlamydiales bacterium SCGC AG-110-M15]|nr:Serine/threonine-protein phosphatase CPPED1 [Chlamydiales bacterium SCGC AG-110-M15]